MLCAIVMIRVKKSDVLLNLWPYYNIIKTTAAGNLRFERLSKIALFLPSYRDSHVCRAKAHCISASIVAF